MILEASAHPFHAESGGPAALAGVMMRGARGRARHVHGRAGARGDPARRLPPCAALAPARGREHDATSAAARSGRSPQIRAVTGGRPGARPRLPHGRRAPDERGGRERRLGRRLRGAVQFGLDRLLQGAGRAGRRRARRLARTSSTRRGGSSSRSAAPCARPGSSPPPACTRSITTSSVWPRTTPTRAIWPRGWPRSPASSSIRRRVETNIVWFDVARG